MAAESVTAGPKVMWAGGKERVVAEIAGSAPPDLGSQAFTNGAHHTREQHLVFY